MEDDDPNGNSLEKNISRAINIFCAINTSSRCATRKQKMPVQYDPHGQFVIANLTQGPAGYISGVPYSGPVQGLDTQMDLSNGNAYHVDVLTKNYFLFTGGRDDFIDAGFWAASRLANNLSFESGSTPFVTSRDIIDGGGGSNFIIAGPDQDTIYVDGRNPDHNVWSTVSKFAVDDSATVWGVNLTDFKLDWLDGQGAAGHTGLTAVFSAPGHSAIGLTLSGYSAADLTNGNLTVAFGHTGTLPGIPGADYMTVVSHGLPG